VTQAVQCRIDLHGALTHLLEKGSQGSLIHLY
jgi:hypothetical protein